MFKAVVTADLRDPRFLRLFDSSFPVGEKIPPYKLRRTIGNGGRMLYFFDGDEYIGFCFTFEAYDIMYVAYIAVEPSKRGMGYGSDILDYIASEKKRKGMFLTAESIHGDGRELKERYDRRRFYRRNGWKQSGTKLLTKDGGMDVYELDSNLPEEDVLGVLERFYSFI